MTDWIHCNKCFHRFQSNVNFYVTTCGHITCASCASKMDNNRCLVCKTQCEKTQLSHSMSPDLQMFFRPAAEALDKDYQVLAFQQSNALKLCRHISAKYDICKKEIAKNCKRINELKKEQMQLKMALRASENHVPGTTPPFSVSSVGSVARRHSPFNSALKGDASFMQSPGPWNQPINAAKALMTRKNQGINTSQGHPSFPLGVSPPFNNDDSFSVGNNSMSSSNF